MTFYNFFKIKNFRFKEIKKIRVKINFLTIFFAYLKLFYFFFNLLKKCVAIGLVFASKRLKVKNETKRAVHNSLKTKIVSTKKIIQKIKLLLDWIQICFWLTHKLVIKMFTNSSSSSRTSSISKQLLKQYQQWTGTNFKQLRQNNFVYFLMLLISCLFCLSSGVLFILTASFHALIPSFSTTTFF